MEKLTQDWKAATTEHLLEVLERCEVIYSDNVDDLSIPYYQVEEYRDAITEIEDELLRRDWEYQEQGEKLEEQSA